MPPPIFPAGSRVRYTGLASGWVYLYPGATSAPMGTVDLESVDNTGVIWDPEPTIGGPGAYSLFDNSMSPPIAISEPPHMPFIPYMPQPNPSRDLNMNPFSLGSRSGNGMTHKDKAEEISRLNQIKSCKHLKLCGCGVKKLGDCALGLGNNGSVSIVDCANCEKWESR